MYQLELRQIQQTIFEHKGTNKVNTSTKTNDKYFLFFININDTNTNATTNTTSNTKKYLSLFNIASL